AYAPTRTSRYRRTTVSSSYGRQLSAGGGGTSPASAAAIPSASASSSPTGTRSPYRPPSRISLGPLRQSVATTGAPQKSASIRTDGRPSHLDESTNAAAPTMYGYGLPTQPGKLTDAFRPRVD